MSKWSTYLVLPLEWLAVCIVEQQWVDGVFRLVCAEPYQRDDGTLEIIVAVNAHGVGVHRPAADHARQGRQLVPHGAQAVRRDAL